MLDLVSEDTSFLECFMAFLLTFVFRRMFLKYKSSNN